jgi:hypothetical protein
LNNNPPPPEVRPVFAELDFCRRYFSASYGNGIALGTATRLNMVGGMAAFFVGSTWTGSATSVQFPTEMRAIPSFSYWDGAGNASRYTFNQGSGFADNAGAISMQALGTRSFIMSMPSNAGASMFIHYAASAEL